MTVWVVAFAAVAAILLATADFALKQASGRINPALGTLVYALSAVILPVGWVAFEAVRGTLSATREGVLWSMAVGLAFSASTALFVLLFRAGADLSVTSPAIRAGSLVLIGLLGILVLGERLSWQYAIGLAMTIAGILVLVTASSS